MSKPRNDLTPAYIRSRLAYDRETGILTWKKYPKLGPSWNNRFVGERAGSIQNVRKYWVVSLDRRQYLAHRLAWVIVKGKWPKDQIDHKNGKVGDNKFKNLREASNRQNARNSRKQNRSSTGYKGVSYHNTGGFINKWEARIVYNRKSIYLGCHRTAKLAHAAYSKAAKKYHGEFARVR